MIKIIYFHRLSFAESEERFVDEAKKLGVELVMVKYRQLRLVGDRIMFGDLDIKDVNGWYFRAVGTELEWSKLLQKYAIKHGVAVVDQYLLSEGPLRRFKSVMGWQLVDGGVNYPKTIMVENINDLKLELANWQYPLVVKMSSGGRHGMSTFWLRKSEDITELEQKINERIEQAKTAGKEVPIFRGFLVQEYIPNDGDYRVMTVGYKCIGGFKRAPKEEKMVMNKSLGKSIGLKEVPADVAQEAEKAAEVLGVEVAGTDLVRNSIDNKVYIVEVNEAPQFKVFEKRTGVNAAGKIMDYLVMKFSR